MTTPPVHPVDVLLLLIHQDHVLLALRDGTGYADGQWNLPSGKLELEEDAVSGIIRESHEEIGVRLHQTDLRMVATVHHRNHAGHSRVGLAFAATFHPGRHAQPVNAEPHKCAKIGWFPTDTLPANTYPYTRTCVHAFSEGEPFALSGW